MSYPQLLFLAEKNRNQTKMASLLVTHVCSIVYLYIYIYIISTICKKNERDLHGSIPSDV